MNDVLAQPHIAKLTFAHLECPVQTAVLDWWARSRGIADLNDPNYLALTPHLQVALDGNKRRAARFIYVGHKSMPAEMLGKDFTSAVHAGEWWDDGGYAEAVSGAYEEVSENRKPVLEEIRASLRPPSSNYSAQTLSLHYDRLCLATAFSSGQRTITVVTSQHRTKPQESNVVPLFDDSRAQ